jgi:hypothetical protein
MNQSQNCLHGRSPMMRKLRLVSALTLTSMAVAAQAPPAAAPATKPDVTVIGKQPPKMKLVCETFVPTGSIKSQRICTTQAEVDREHDDSLIEIQRLQDQQMRSRELCRVRGGMC